MPNLFKWGGGSVPAAPPEPEVTLIFFNIGGADYQAEEGMTFGEWVSSGYNPGRYYIYKAKNVVAYGELDNDGTLPVVTGPANYNEFGPVYANTEIMNGGYYQHGSMVG